MMATILVSVIIPTYNSARYLPETIMSVLNQKYKKLEVIVVDDGSTDNTREIVKQYPVKYVYQQNQGTSNAMNTGIKRSQGEFYITLGADDLLDPKYVELCLDKILKDRRIAFVWTGTREFGVSHEVHTPVPIRNRFSVYRGLGGQLGAAMFRRKAYEQVGGYDEALQVYEDWDLVIRMIKNGWTGVPIIEPIHYWRRHQMSRNKKASPEVLRGFLEKKYPRMKWYARSARVFDFFILSITDQKEFVNRLSRKIH